MQDSPRTVGICSSIQQTESKQATKRPQAQLAKTSHRHWMEKNQLDWNTYHSGQHGAYKLLGFWQSTYNWQVYEPEDRPIFIWQNIFS